MDIRNYGLLNKLQRLISESNYTRRLRLKSLKICNTYPIFDGSASGIHIELKIDQQTGERKANFLGLGQCQNVWACPVCAPRKIQEYRLKITKVIEHWREKGYTAAMVTLTIPHYCQQSATEVMTNLKESYKVFSRNYINRWRRDHNAPGTISAYECKYSKHNGWHFHLHLVIVMPKEEFPRFKKIEAHWREQWNKITKPLEIYPTRTDIHCGLFFSKNEIKNGDYIAKELAKPRGSNKKNKFNTIDVFELLESDNPEENERFLEFCDAVRGRNRITIGTKLSRGLDFSEIKKKHAAQQEENITTAVVATFTYNAWFEIIRAESGEFPHRMNILHAAEIAELAGVLLYCKEHKLPLPHEPTISFTGNAPILHGRRYSCI